jgi:glycosyltransferase involved in cell wall biosynthesis
MRILVVNPYGHYGHYSGPAILMERLFSTVATANDVVVLGGRDAAPRAGYGWARRTVALSANDSLGGLQQLMWSVRAFLWVLARGHQFDLVHLHGAYLFNLVPALAARLRGVPYVVIALAARGDLSADSRLARLPLLGALRRNLVSHAAGGYALADDIRAEFEGLGLSAGKVHPLGNAVDVEKYQPRFDLVDDPRINSRTLIFVGKIGRRKRATMILEAVALLHQQGHDARAVFVGPFDDSQFELEFRRLSAHLGLDEFIITTGHVTDVDSYLLADVSLFILPSEQEGLPGALVEAMAAGLPCAVTDVGSMGDVVRTADAGQVIEPEAAAIAAFAVKVWADVDQWRAWSCAGRNYAVSHYSTQQVAEQYLGPIRASVDTSGKKAFDAS